MPSDAAGGHGTVVIVGGGPIIGGKEIMLLNLGRGLRDCGYRPVFVTSVWGGKDAFVSRLEAEGFEYFRVRSGFISKTLRWKPMLWTTIQLAYWPSFVIGYLRAIKKSAPIVVVHSNWHHALLLLPFLDRRRDIYWSHEIVPEARHYRWIFAAVVRRVARIVCVSDAVRRALQRIGVPTIKLSVVHNGVSFRETVRPPRSELPLRLGIVGQIGPWKGHDDALVALAQIPRETAVLKIFGSGNEDYVMALKAKAQALGISDRVEWCGFVADAAEIYGEMDICLVLSRDLEAFPTVALEAGAFGRLTICTGLGGLSEIVIDQMSGYHVAAYDPPLLANTIKNLIGNPNSILSMGAAAKAHVQARFSAQHFTKGFMTIIAGVAGPNTSGIEALP